DATRTPHGFLAQAVETAIAAGATTINLPDTVGYATPTDISEMFTYVMAHVTNADRAIFSFHGQNDLGLATANTLAALQAGARQAEVTINGIGERAGNTALEEIVMTLKTRKDRFGFETGIKSEHIMRASRLIQSITGQGVQVNKAIVGANAFAHESGIHQDGMLKHAGTYEIMTPESVGLNSSSLVLGKHSGRHAFRDKLKTLGFELGDNAFEDVFERFKELADKKKEMYDDDIISLLDVDSEAENRLALRSLAVHSGTEGPQTAVLRMTVHGEARQITMEGNGPVDAIFQGIRALVPEAEGAELKLYQVHAITGGTDAQAEVTVRLEKAGRVINGHGNDPDTLVASAKAYINALAKIGSLQEKITLLTN
ncbi:MAG: 2-isopropylmalate synthase, partial [Rickettsiales bacterium]|nr:2-isopropylmalate synthase [Rickettsiales bacterium]